MNYSNFILVRDCPRKNIWRMKLFPEYKTNRDEKYKTEKHTNMMNRIKSFIDNVPKHKHIIIVTHSGLIQKAIETLFNVVPKLQGDLTNGKNTTITAILKTKNKYKLLTLPNTKHLK